MARALRPHYPRNITVPSPPPPPTPLQESSTDGMLTISVPDLAALGAGEEPDNVPSAVQSWTLEQLGGALAPVLAAARAGGVGPSLRPPALRPAPAITAALDALAAECPDEPARKALAPVLFLSCGILYDHLFGAAPPGGPAQPPAGAAAVAAAASPLGRPLRGLRVTVHVPTLPVGAGLGSSAAFAVSTAGALMDALAQAQGSGWGMWGGGGGGVAPPRGWAPADASWLPCVNDWAYSCEMLFHGVPSGLDNTVAT